MGRLTSEACFCKRASLFHYFNMGALIPTWPGHTRPVEPIGWRNMTSSFRAARDLQLAVASRNIGRPKQLDATKSVVRFARALRSARALNKRARVAASRNLLLAACRSSCVIEIGHQNTIGHTRASNCVAGEDDASRTSATTGPLGRQNGAADLRGRPLQPI